MYGFPDTVNLLACAPGRALHLQCRVCGYKFYDKRVQRLVKARQNGMVASVNMFVISHLLLFTILTMFRVRFSVYMSINLLAPLTGHIMRTTTCVTKQCHIHIHLFQINLNMLSVPLPGHFT